MHPLTDAYFSDDCESHSPEDGTFFYDDSISADNTPAGFDMFDDVGSRAPSSSAFKFQLKLLRRHYQTH